MLQEVFKDYRILQITLWMVSLPLNNISCLINKSLLIADWYTFALEIYDSEGKYKGNLPWIRLLDSFIAIVKVSIRSWHFGDSYKVWFSKIPLSLHNEISKSRQTGIDEEKNPGEDNKSPVSQRFSKVKHLDTERRPLPNFHFASDGQS